MSDPLQPAVEGSDFKRLSYVLQRIFVPGAPYSPPERVVIVYLTHRMRFDPASQSHCTFQRVSVIAAGTGLSHRTVQRALREQARSPAPLIAISTPGATNGIKHHCSRFTLVTNIAAFVRARDASRAARGAKLTPRDIGTRWAPSPSRPAHDLHLLEGGFQISGGSAFERGQIDTREGAKLTPRDRTRGLRDGREIPSGSL